MFILNLVYSGISSGIGMLAAQYWGKKDTRTIEEIMGIGMRLSIPVSFFFFVMACFFPQVLMMIFTSEQELIRAGIPYLRIVGVSYLFMSISQVYLCTMRSIERVVFATFTNASALLLNILLNAVFIFGLLGAPPDGDHGRGPGHHHRPGRGAFALHGGRLPLPGAALPARPPGPAQ